MFASLNMCAGHVRPHQGGQPKRGHTEDDPPGCLQGDGQGGYSNANPEITALLICSWSLSSIKIHLGQT
jgi:hypothetical protein